ncbi:MAG: hypothetical protein EOP04_12320, partial [Proteobacteria bacterium]
RQREKNVAPKRKAFQIALHEVSKRISDGELQRKSQEVLVTFQGRIATAIERRTSDPEVAALSIIEAEDIAKQELDALRKSYRVIRPGSLALPPKMRSDFEAYLFEWRKVDESIFKSVTSQISREANDSFGQLEASVETRMRLEMILNERTGRLKRETEEKTRQLRKLISEMAREADSVVRENLSHIHTSITNALREAATIDTSKMAPSELASWQNSLEQNLDNLGESSEILLQSLETQLQGLNLKLDEQGELTGVTEEADALEEDVLALRERAETDFELSQLGLAVEVVGHEFANSIQDVRRNLQSLGAWAKKNPSLNPLYQSLRVSFDHLDGYLTLFTPLNRRLYRSKSKFTGAEIAKFVRGLLSEQLEKAEVNLIISDEFLSKAINGYPSTFYPVFINLVDNAIFWVSNTPLPREIILDADNNAFIVADSGPGVLTRDRDTIFEMRFSRKPGGRGLGLFIARQGLAKDDYTLKLADSGPLRGATFRIEPLEKIHPELPDN